MTIKIPVAQPDIGELETQYVLDCLNTKWISSNGSYISKLESKFASMMGVKHAITTNNGTTALHLALVALDLKPGDEVIVPTITYIATANAVSYCGAKPVLVDVLPGSLNIDPSKIEDAITPKTKGIIAVHLYGYPADMGAIKSIAEHNDLWVLEDAAESHKASINGKFVGSIGDCGVFSFFGNKIMTTGEGGMITTNDDALASRMRLFRGQGMDVERRYWHPVIGYNYRMTNIQAAIGLAQLERLDKLISRRDHIKRVYDYLLKDHPDIELNRNPNNYRDVCWLYNIFIKNCSRLRRDAIMKLMLKDGIETRPVFYPLHIMPPYENNNNYPIADDWYGRGINLPTYSELTEAEIKEVIKSLVKAIDDTKFNDENWC